MTPAEVYQILETVTYKPGWTIRAEVPPPHWSSSYQDHRNPEDIELRVIARMPDVHTGRIIPVQTAYLMSLHRLTREGLLLQLKLVIERMEMHEMCEFLKVDGKHLEDPHPELKKNG